MSLDSTSSGLKVSQVLALLLHLLEKLMESVPRRDSEIREKIQDAQESIEDVRQTHPNPNQELENVTYQHLVNAIQAIVIDWDDHNPSNNY